MRTTVDLPEALYKYAKMAATKENVRFSDIVADGLSLRKNTLKSQKPEEKIELPVWDLGEPLIDLTDKELVQHLLDKEDHPQFFKQGDQ